MMYQSPIVYSKKAVHIEYIDTCIVLNYIKWKKKSYDKNKVNLLKIKPITNYKPFIFGFLVKRYNKN